MGAPGKTPSEAGEGSHTVTTGPRACEPGQAALPMTAAASLAVLCAWARSVGPEDTSAWRVAGPRWPTGSHIVNSETSRSLAMLPRPALPPSRWVAPRSLGAPGPPGSSWQEGGARAAGVKGGRSASAGSALRESLVSYGPLGYQCFSPFLGTWCATCSPKKKGGRRASPQQTSHNPKMGISGSNPCLFSKAG